MQQALKANLKRLKTFLTYSKNYLKRNNPIKVSSFVSTDGGENFSEPKDLTSQIYGFDTSWTRLFVTSGRIAW